ncbi:MAG: ABC transporter substrate-binding protein [Acidimicrobiia bacterium]|nr:ABC transporter substrate-binding protein [Acidimicrobiia bacterium]
MRRVLKRPGGGPGATASGSSRTRGAQMLRHRSRAVLTGLVGLGLLASACGSSGSDDGTVATFDEGLQAGVKEGLQATSTTTAAAAEFTSIEEWEELWAQERAAIVERIKGNGWGTSADGATLTGPEGYEVDLTTCPAGWSDTEGLTDTTIKIGHTAPMSGPLADVGNYMHVLNALLAHYNQNGGFPDSTGKARQAQLVMRDDAYDPARTIPLVDELIDSEKVFAVGTVGTPNQVRVFGKLNERCIPHPAISGHNSVGDPVGHPWTTSSSISYTSEALLIGQLVEERLDSEFGGDAKVAVLYFSNDFGTAFDQGFESFLASSARGADIEYVTEVVEPAAVTMKDPMTTLAAEQPDVFVAAIAGAACTQVITEAAENGMNEQVPYRILDSACKVPVRPAELGGAADGWYAVGGGYRDIMAAENDDDPWMVFARQVLADQGLDYKESSSFNSGFFYSWPWIQALLIAGELDGGLTRANFNLAFRALDMTHPHLYPGVQFNMDGGKDAFFVEGSDITRWDEAAQTWQLITVVDVSGRTKPCHWDPTANACS